MKARPRRRIDINLEELDQLIDRSMQAPLSASEGEKLKTAMHAAEAANHHPDLDIRYRRLRVALSTHSEGGITDQDFALAAQIDAAAP